MPERKVHKILVNWADTSWEQRVRRSLGPQDLLGVNVVFETTGPGVIREMIDADVAYVGSFDAQMLAAARRLKWVHAMSGGVSHCLFPEFVRSPVPLTCLKELFATAGAEFALASMLMICRRFLHAIGDRKLPQSAAPMDDALAPEDLSGKTVGIVGMGNMGRALARRARCLGMTVLVTARRPRADETDADEFLPIERLTTLLARSDFVALAVALTSQTQGLFGREAFGAMKQHAWLIDLAGRPPLFDYEAMRATVRARKIGGVVLQPCGNGHPGVPSEASEFWSLPNVIVSPCRATSKEQNEASLDLFVQNLRCLERGEPLRGLVDKEAGY